MESVLDRVLIGPPQGGQLDGLLSLWRDTFGDSDEFLADFLRTAYSPSRCRCVTVDGAVVAMLYWFDCSLGENKIAYLYAVATRQELRGRGICRMLMQDTHRHLADLGYGGAILCPASEGLFEFYRKIGYTSVTAIGKIDCAAAESGVPLRSVGAEEYGRLRRELLPAGGVIQEGVSLDFLATQAKLYVGEGILLCARESGGRLLGLELLGDVEKAPAILATLGYSGGSFRTPHAPRRKPFAAYLPLSSAPAPGYLGLAFD